MHSELPTYHQIVRIWQSRPSHISIYLSNVFTTKDKLLERKSLKLQTPHKPIYLDQDIWPCRVGYLRKSVKHLHHNKPKLPSPLSLLLTYPTYSTDSINQQRYVLQQQQCFLIQNFVVEEKLMSCKQQMWHSLVIRFCVIILDSKQWLNSHEYSPSTLFSSSPLLIH